MAAASTYIAKAMNRLYVCCRVRPSKDRGGYSLIPPNSLQSSESAKSFTYDKVFNSGSQQEVFEIVGKRVAQGCIKGHNGTIFAYGQTGSGKTYTILGPTNCLKDEKISPHTGL